MLNMNHPLFAHLIPSHTHGSSLHFLVDVLHHPVAGLMFQGSAVPSHTQPIILSVKEFN